MRASLRSHAVVTAAACRAVALAVSLSFLVLGCASRTTPVTSSGPRYPDYPSPDVPAGLAVPADLRSRHQAAWQLLQAGNARRAEQEFRAILRALPSFYPAETALGFVLVSGRQYRNAEPRFAAAIAANARYVPAWVGRAEALVGMGSDREAIVALERVIALEPRRDGARTRIEFLRLRLTQAAVERARRARQAGRLEQADQELEAALAAAPGSTLLLAELVAVELAAGQLAEAETHARRAVQLDGQSAERHAQLGDVLDAAKRYREAAASYNRAVALDARPEWRARALDLREKAEDAALPASFSRIGTAPAVTRGEVAAYLGIHLEAVISRAPRRVTDVATDIRTHWAATWIVPVTQAGVMSIYPNHTFQPGGTVRRIDLASIVATLLRLAAIGRRAELTKWQAARPRFVDLPPTHVSYAAVALAVSSGALSVDADGAFGPSRQASGRDLEAAVRRIDAIATP